MALRGSASFKKRDGMLVLAADRKHLSWTPVDPPNAPPEVTLMIPTVTNLQQTGREKAKVILRVFSKPANSAESISYLFNYSSPTDARAEAEAILKGLTAAVQAAKKQAENGGTSAALAIAGAVTSQPARAEDWEDDAKLLSNNQLHKSLLDSNSALQRTFAESLRTKPDSLSSTQFSTQFWSTRLNLLRAHAIERGQSKGAYNVLSTMKSHAEDDKMKINMTRDQVNLIFSQHPIVKRVYDESVPKIEEVSFWARFFDSRLLKKLKGERLTDADKADPIIDKYTKDLDALEHAQRNMSAHIPHIIDMEGNEQNHSQRKGNAPDLWMRPTAVERVPIIRTLNSLSEKILSQVQPSDVDPSQPIGMDEATFNALALRDLQGDETENRLILNVKDQSRFFASGKGTDSNSEFQFEQRSAKELRAALNPEIKGLSGLDLQSGIGVDEDSSDSDEEGTISKHMGSRVALKQASAQVFAAVAEQMVQTEDAATGDPTVERAAAAAHLSTTIFDRVSLTHATTTEFLHHFWMAFLSGDPAKAEEIKRLVETLDRAMDRIRAVAEDAQRERTEEVQKQKRKVRDYYERTRHKLAFDAASIKGGAEAVNQLMAPTVEAIQIASTKYAEALAEAEASRRATSPDV